MTVKNHEWLEWTRIRISYESTNRSRLRVWPGIGLVRHRRVRRSAWRATRTLRSVRVAGSIRQRRRANGGSFSHAASPADAGGPTFLLCVPLRHCVEKNDEEKQPPASAGEVASPDIIGAQRYFSTGASASPLHSLQP